MPLPHFISINHHKDIWEVNSEVYKKHNAIKNRINKIKKIKSKINE